MCVFLRIAALVASLWIVTAAYAQSEPGSGIPEIPDPEQAVAERAAMEERQRAYDAAFHAYLETVLLEDLTVVYLAAQPEMDYINSESIAEGLGAQVVWSWEAFEALLMDEELDAVLIHGGAAADINTDWTQAAYRRGVLLVGLSMPFEEMQRITGDKCLEDPNPGYLALSPQMFLVFQYDLKVENDEDREAINHSVLETCEALEASQFGWYTIQRGTLNSFILSPDWLPWMGDLIRTTVANRRYVAIYSELPFPVEVK
jgi:hypothetical protein